MRTIVATGHRLIAAVTVALVARVFLRLERTIT